MVQSGQEINRVPNDVLCGTTAQRSFFEGNLPYELTCGIVCWPLG
jgi:hypothetical protein